MTMLIVTHEMKFARDVSTRIFFMYDGYIHEAGTPKQIFESPRRSATKAFVQRIRKEVFEVENADFDFLDMETRIQQFCIKYNITEVSKRATQLCQLAIPYFLTANKPLTVRITHSELSGDSSLDFMVEDITHSPLQDSNISPDKLAAINGLCSRIVEEPTTRGFRIKYLF